ncbi:MAG: divergent polysaccharide deacetylase family protein [Deltaproteobacteria bacterium]|nr:divergent polysaccharide deacetylase family protein [Candidatus Anaeroferrophillacea bacterium]
MILAVVLLLVGFSIQLRRERASVTSRVDSPPVVAPSPIVGSDVGGVTSQSRTTAPPEPFSAVAAPNVPPAPAPYDLHGPSPDLLELDAVITRQLPPGQVEALSEWVSGGGGERWLLTRWEGWYHDVGVADELLAACGAEWTGVRAGRLQSAHLDDDRTLQVSFLEGGRVVGTLRLHWLAPRANGGRQDTLHPPRVAIIIDDMGMNVDIARRLADIPAALTFSVFPFASRSVETAALLRERRRYVMLHLPMEPHGYPEIDPGPGALLVDMTDVRCVQLLDSALEAFPGIAGINNHMGSRLTEDEHKMTLVMRFLAARSRPHFFVDSRTSAASVAYETACREHVAALQRDVFLDNIRDPQYITAQLEKLLAIAGLRRTAVGIGHPYPETVAALARLPELCERAGVEVVPVNELLPAAE